MSRRASRLAEVQWGENEEQPILSRWMRESSIAFGADRVIRSRQAQDWDYLMLDRRGVPIAFVEIKKRRIPFADFGDAMCPIRKHDLAVELRYHHRLPFVMVVLYKCGTLIEVNLLDEPAERRDVTRRDRDRAVPHGIWRGDQVKIVSGPPSLADAA